MKSIITYLFILFFITGCSTTRNFNIKKQSVTGFELYKMSNAPMIGTTLSGQKIKLGGFSGLIYTGDKDGSLFFQTVTDRGPSGELDGIDRSFLLPEYSPTVVVLKIDNVKNNLSVSAEIKLRKRDGAPLTGLPNNRLEENPTDIFGLYYSVDPNGLDIEGLTFDGEGGWWMADEYAPSLVHFNEDGKMIRRIFPGAELPRMYNERKPNRGFEAIAKFENKIFGFLQSPLPKEQASESGEFSRIVEVDLDTMKTTAEYFYMFEKGNDTIGDAVAIAPNTFLVIEQNGQIKEKSQKYIYKITTGETDRLVKKTLIADLKNTPFNDMQKIEGLAFVNEKKLALIYDNDYQIDGKTNHATGLTPLNDSVNQLLILNFKESLLEATGN